MIGTQCKVFNTTRGLQVVTWCVIVPKKFRSMNHEINLLVDLWNFSDDCAISGCIGERFHHMYDVGCKLPKRCKVTTI